MKICVLGLESAAPEIVFGDERLVNLRRLMDLGVYGKLESVIPPTAVPAWMCMSSSQDPGSLGVYGFRNHANRSYGSPESANSTLFQAPTIWEYLGGEGKKSIIVGIPPSFPPRPINGISVGCFLTPDAAKNDFTFPPEFKAKISEAVGEYPFELNKLRPDDTNWLKEEIFKVSRKQWELVRWLLVEQEWDYFHFVDMGLDRIQRALWSHFDPTHRQFAPGNPQQDAIPEYYRWLDEQIGSVLELLDNDTILLIVSDHGAQRLDGSFAINEWLIREGLLVLNQYPKVVTPFEQLNVNWSKTKAWSEGIHHARVFFNVQGREPQGIVPASEYESFQDEMKSRLESLADDTGRTLTSHIFKPKEIYRNLRNVSPDLIAYFGELHWRSLSTVGHSALHVREQSIGVDTCNHTQHGMFILAAPNCPLSGEYEGAQLLDIAPTLLDLAGHKIPDTMQGRSLVAGMEKKNSGSGSDSESERIVHDRLGGLGYV
jgi:predicted AlkP superfamily phosphohydrolase/phosphomutase